MKTFLAIYLGEQDSPNRIAWDKMDEPARNKRVEAGLKAWGAWNETHKAAIVADAAPLGKTKRVSSAGIADVRNNMAVYTVVQADSHEAAARMFANHPHFTIFPGDAIEVMECLPVPGHP